MRKYSPLLAAATENEWLKQISWHYILHPSPEILRTAEVCRNCIRISRINIFSCVGWRSRRFCSTTTRSYSDYNPFGIGLLLAYQIIIIIATVFYSNVSKQERHVVAGKPPKYPGYCDKQHGTLF